MKKFYIFALIGLLSSCSTGRSTTPVVTEPTETVIPSDVQIAKNQGSIAREKAREASIPALNRPLSDRPITVGGKTWANERELIVDVCKSDWSIKDCR